MAEIYNSRRVAAAHAELRNNNFLTDQKYRLIVVSDGRAEVGLRFIVGVAYTIDRAIDEVHKLTKKQHAFVVELPNIYPDRPDIRFMAMNSDLLSRYFPDAQDASVLTPQRIVYRAFSHKEIRMKETRGRNIQALSDRSKLPLRHERPLLFLVK
jgi:hypothetical protein